MNHKILVHVRPVITKSDYKETLARIEVLMDLSQKTKKEAAELDIHRATFKTTLAVNLVKLAGCRSSLAGIFG